VLPGPVGRHQPHEQGLEIAEHERLLPVRLECLLEEGKRALGRGVGLGQPFADLGAALVRQPASDATGNRPGRMDLPAAEHLYDLLSKLAQPDPGAGEPRVGRDQAEYIPRSLGRLPAEDEVRRAQVEEAQGMALYDLPQVHQAPKLVRRRRDGHGHDRVARL
jgi:hypothetical protein